MHVSIGEMKVSAKETEMFGKILKIVVKTAVALGLVEKLKDKLSGLIDKASDKATRDLHKQVDKAKNTHADLKVAEKLLKQ